MSRKKIILFFIYSHDKLLALSLLNPLEKNPGVATGLQKQEREGKRVHKCYVVWFDALHP